MKRITIFSIFLALGLSACNKGPETNSAIDFKSTWSDQGTYSFTDVDNYAIGYAAGDKESLDKMLAEFLLNAVEREEMVFLDEEDKQITAKEAKSRLVQTTSLKREDPDEEGEFYIESVERIITANEIAQVVAREDWSFNENTFSIQKKVTHLAPIIYVLDTDGDVRGKKLLFWVKVN
jgi:hypothetical protein